MKIILGVKKFGKIKSANIDISNFTMFVGNNNSGKTYMMQLIYGVLKEIPRINDTLKSFFIDIAKQDVIEQNSFVRYEEKVNQYLMQNKENIVLRTFHRNIPIEALYVKLEEIQEKIFLSYGDKKSFSVKEQNRLKEAKIYMAKDRLEILASLHLNDEQTHNITFGFYDDRSLEEKKGIAAQHAVEYIVGTFHGRNELYFPASRTGMLLLYKYFFSEKNDDAQKNYFVSDDKKEYGNAFGLSEPVYDFLRFLMRYTPNEMASKNNGELIRFIEEHLIEGTVVQTGDEDIYTPQNSEVHVPLYLASSMVNELAPVLRMLTENQRYRTVFYDEIETCLHPSKQIEMARLLVRLNNQGKHLIISTHSDTMATKINNLLLLSFAELSEEERIKKLKQLNLEEKDLLKTKNVHVYQFENKSDGSSEVKELEFRKVPYTGFDFSQFVDSVQNLYEETLAVME